jgi:hypothetical protein
MQPLTNLSANPDFADFSDSSGPGRTHHVHLASDHWADGLNA